MIYKLPQPFRVKLSFLKYIFQTLNPKFFQTLKPKTEGPQVNILGDNNESNAIPEVKQQNGPGDPDSNTLKVYYSRSRRSVPQGRTTTTSLFKDFSFGIYNFHIFSDK